MNCKKKKLNDSEILLILLFIAVMAQTTAKSTSNDASANSQNEQNSGSLQKPSVDIKTISPRTQKLLAVITRNKEAHSWKKARYVEGYRTDSRKFMIQLNMMNKGEDSEEATGATGRSYTRFKVLAALSPEKYPQNTVFSSKTITLATNSSSFSSEFELSYECEEEYKISATPWMKVSISLINDKSGEELTSFSYYKFCADVKLRKFDLSLCFIVAIAILSVAVFSKRGILGAPELEHLKATGDFASSEEFETESIKTTHCLYFTLICSLTLLILFYFFKYFELILNSCFTGVSFISLWGMATAICLEMKSGKGKFIIQEIEKYSEHLLIIAASFVIAVAYFLTKHWVLNNIIALSLVFFSLKIVKLPSLYVSTMLLCFSFCYDVFWVLVSKHLFGASVMDSVASNLQLPLKLEMPIFQDYPLQINSILGLGDLLLPGLFISFCHRIDKTLRLGGCYYNSAVIGFSIGLVQSLFSLWFWDHAQPALLYIAPSLLFTTFISGAVRGEISKLWRLEEVL